MSDEVTGGDTVSVLVVDDLVPFRSAAPAVYKRADRVALAGAAESGEQVTAPHVDDRLLEQVEQLGIVQRGGDVEHVRRE